MDIEGKGAIVTGGASGLGQATAELLASRGAKVGLFDLPSSKGSETASKIGGNALFLEGDVTSEEQVAAAVDRAVESFGSISILVNCAGTGSASRTVRKDGTPFDLDQFKRTIEINLIGTFNAIRLAAGRMIANPTEGDGERGVIVNTASVAAFEGQIGQAAYSASKGGVVGMTLPIARDLARHGVRCCTIAPGLFDTPMLALMPQEMKDSLGATVPFPSRLGNPAEYALLACQIVENPMPNGETIRLDGAIRMQPR
jgi:NAD(P)-dependent dehydrogenase (short-subunit alcohol dehydrogenase family)